MANWHAISKEKHANAGWVAPTGYLQTSGESVAPVLVAELGQLTPYYPLVFSMQNGKHKLCALLSLEQSSNLFVNSAGQWMVPYVPAAYRSYPFSMMSNSENKHVLAVDVDSEFFEEQVSKNGQPILNSDGSLADSMSDLVEFMQQRQAQQAQTDNLVAQLAKHNLMQSWTMAVPEAAGSKARQLVGFYRINESAMRELDASALKELAETGALGVAYAQLFSQARMKALQDRYVQYKEFKNKQAFDSVDLDKVFDGGSDNDLFSF